MSEAVGGGWSRGERHENASKNNSDDLVLLEPTDAVWYEYDNAASWCASQGLKGKPGDRLPPNTSEAVHALIADEPEAFEELVNKHAYAQAMASIDPEEK